jgi:hypothetical protein
MRAAACAQASKTRISQIRSSSAPHFAPGRAATCRACSGYQDMQINAAAAASSQHDDEYRKPAAVAPSTL